MPSSAFRILFLTLLCVFCLGSLGAAGTAEVAENSISSEKPFLVLSDYYQRSITLKEAPQRVVSLAPGITETVFALGYGDRLVGRTSFCDYPPEAGEVEEMGGLTNPDLESIVEADPDLIIASTHFPADALELLEQAGLTVAVFIGDESFEGIYNGIIRPVAEVLGDRDAGEALIADMQKTVAETDALAASWEESPRVYYMVGFGEGGDWTAGGDTYIGGMIERAGGKNIAGDVSGWAFSSEALVDRDPDLILLPSWAKDLFGLEEPYSKLRAVRNGNLAVVDEDMVVRQGPRAAEGYASLLQAMRSVR